MIAFDEAQARLAGAVRPIGVEAVPLAQAHGRVLAEPVHAAIASPRCPVSAMDGYAVRDTDAASGARFRVVGHSFAGGPPPPPVGSGEAVRIFTGAAMPAGADRVVMQEDCTAEADMMTLAAEPSPRRHVRETGSDFPAGALLLDAGRLLDPKALVALAGADRAMAAVYRKPRVAIIATGDELAPPGTARTDPRAIPESVSFGVAAMVAECGAEMMSRFTGRDSLEELRRIAEKALAATDVVIVTGGASVGERDYAKAMFAGQDLKLTFPSVAIRPGKPVWLGRARGRWVLGLPGNPTSAMITARLFLAPLLAALQGRSPATLLEWEGMPLAPGLPGAAGRTVFVRARRQGDALMPTDNQDSSSQAALSACEWLIRRDPGDQPIAAGSMVQALRF